MSKHNCLVSHFIMLTTTCCDNCGPSLGINCIYIYIYIYIYGSTVVKVLCYKSEGRWFDPSWCHWIFHIYILYVCVCVCVGRVA